MGRLALSSSNRFLILLAIVIVIGGAIVYRLRREVEEDDGSTTEADLLADLEQAYFAGEMEEAEFRRVTEALKAKKSNSPAPSRRIKSMNISPEPPAVEADPEEFP